MSDEAAEIVESGSLTPAMLSAFLNEPIIARLATVDAQQRPHVVPVWFGWDGESIWISSFESTKKNHHLQTNPNVSIVIDIAESANDIQAVIFEGPAELIDQPRDLVQRISAWIYARYLGEQEVQKPRYQSWISDPENRLIKLTPSRTLSWYSAAKPAKG